MEFNKIYLEQLAEFVGIILGDGSISLKNKNNNSINRLKISLNTNDDSEYIIYIKELIKRLLNEEPKIRHRKNENTTDILIFKRKIIDFFINKVRLKISPKWNNAEIPQQFLRDSLDIKVLRGYFDTDGCLVTTNNNGIIYPRLEMKVCPSPMQETFIKILKKYNFKFGVYQIGKGQVRIQLNGRTQLKKWIRLVGFSNKKHSDKIFRFFN